MDEQLTIPTSATRQISLEQAKREIRSKMKEGSRCPCCGRLVKLYKRKLSAEMVVFLIALCREYSGEYLDIRQLRWWSYQRGDYAYLAHWGLVEQRPGDEEGKRGSAHWRPTEAALRFLSGETRVASHAHIFCGDLVGWSDKLVGAREALGKKFNYQELMAGVEIGEVGHG